MASTRAVPLAQDSSLVVAGAASDDQGVLRGLIGFALFLFLLSCIFDPADRVFGLKVWIFLLCWVITFLVRATSRMQAGVSIHLLAYALLFILIPVLSITWYWFRYGSDEFEGFNMLKGYLLISLAPMLVLNRINLLPQLSAVLTVLALAVLGTFISVQLAPGFFDLLYLLGPSTGVVFVDYREYDSDLKLLQIYFVTSPMLAISIAYYFDQAQLTFRPGVKFLFWGLMAINVLGMLLAGTRNNILISLLLPIALWLLYTKNRTIGLIISGAIVMVLAAVFAGDLRAFFDWDEPSNRMKLALLSGYGDAFSDPLSLIIGQGLGAYQYFGERGYLYVTELTYFEVVRNFGILGATVMFGLLIFPVWYVVAAARPRAEKAIVLGYVFFLVMCFSNPNLFSSMGVLILSVILANMFLPDNANSRSNTRNGL